MSRYPHHPDFRGPRDRSRSPPRFDRRQSAAPASLDNRRPIPASEAPRGPRSQLDGPRPPLLGGIGALGSARTPYSALRDAPPLGSLRDAPPLGSGDRGRPFRERDWECDRRDRVPSPRERSPPRILKDGRDFPPRDLDIGRGRRGSRDGLLPTGSNFADNPPFASSQGRGGYPQRGRGRGDFSYRGGRGGRGNLDDRDLFRRDRSPPLPRWTARDPPRDDREPERRERFERREDDRRAPDWADREREREAERLRREQPPPRLDSRTSTETLSAHPTYPPAPTPAPPINPARLALIESGGADTSVRRPSIPQDVPPSRDARREQPETPSYLNGRAETTANRYASRGSSPPTQAPPVPAFTLSFAPSAPSQLRSTSQPGSSSQEKGPTEIDNDQGGVSLHTSPDAPPPPPPPPTEHKPEPPPEAPTAPKAPPAAPRAQLIGPPVAAPRGPRAFENEEFAAPGHRLHGVRSLESLAAQYAQPGSNIVRAEAGSTLQRPSSTTTSSGDQPSLPTLIQPISPHAPRYECIPPTGPRASRMSPAQAPVSPRPPLTSPRSDIGGFTGPAGPIQAQTPPATAPSGPRNRSFSVSPKVATSSIPTAPKASRVPPVAPRERGPVPPNRPNDRLGAPPQRAPPAAPRANAWNQWRRPGVPPPADKIVPAKRDMFGEERFKGKEPSASSTNTERRNEPVSLEEVHRPNSGNTAARNEQQRGLELDNTKQQPKRQQPSAVSGHSAARSFFGQPTVNDADEDTGMSDAVQGSMSTSEEEDSDLEEDLTLFNAKFERQKRQLEAQMVDLSTRHYRATTPLESIARLSRISIHDLQRINEQREEMDVDVPPALQNRQGHHRASHSSSSREVPDVLTPKAEDDRRVAIASEHSSERAVRRARKVSPEPVSLPYLLKEDHSRESQIFRENAVREEEPEADILCALEDQIIEQEEADQNSKSSFGHMYQRWLEECEELDRVQDEQQRLERHVSLEPGIEVEPPLVAPINPISESRRLHKHSSEYEFAQVLKQSEETARIEQERQDRETKKTQADMEKEAKLPDQMEQDDIRRHDYVDTNTLHNPKSLSAVFSYFPPADTFTEAEQQVFVAAFKDTPKKWGEIASLLPNRTYKDCIHHYYANKWDGRFRDRTKKFGRVGARRGRGGRQRGRHGAMGDMHIGHDPGPEATSEKGRPRRAAAPTNFAEKEAEAKANLLGPSPAKKPGPLARPEGNGEAGAEKAGKRQKRAGEKPGRKPKNAQAALAQLAPQASPANQFIPAMPTKEDMARQQKLEEASLLTNFHGGAHHTMLTPDNPMVYHQEGFMQPMQVLDEPDRTKLAAPSAKQSASSYWSVPEQNDFLKYIAHFGRDFAAIAAHMGTKTQTMIKNHYQRQLDGGSRPELETQAIRAEERRSRGEDLGPPPQPTPIVKRKYDNPQPTMQRPLAPHTEAMEIDEPAPPQRAPVPKHTSPPQFQAQPRFSTSAQSTPIPAARVAPSPLTTAATPMTPQIAPTASARPFQHPIGQRMTFLSDTRPEPRPPSRQEPMFRPAQETPPRNQPAQPAQSAQPARTAPSVPNADYIRNLMEEQDRAFRVQQQSQYAQQDRIEQIQRVASAHRTSAQNSPLHQPMHLPPERKSLAEDQGAPTPPRFSGPTLGRPPAAIGQSGFGQFGAQPFASITSRGFDPSPPKREEPRPGSVPSLPRPSLPQEPPKRSNVMSLLNSEPEEPKAPKRDSAPSIPRRVVSPVTQSHAHANAPSQSAIQTPRREPSFGQLSMSHTFRQHSFGQPGSAPPSAPPPLKQEHSSGAGSSQLPKADWAARVLGQSQAPSPAPSLERDVRPYFQHHQHRSSLLGAVGQSRVNPSPPPMQSTGHSRTSSLTQPQRDPPREQSREQPRPGFGGQPPPNQQPGQPLQPNPYASQQPSPFSQLSHGQSQSHAHHAHNSSITSPFPILHHRAPSREDHIRQDVRPEQYREQLRLADPGRRERERERDEQQRQAYHQRQQQMEAEHRRDEQIMNQRRREEEEQRLAARRGPPPPMPLQQPPTFSGPGFPQHSNLDLRNQSRMEAEMAVREQEQAQQMQIDSEWRRQDGMFQQGHQREQERRRQEVMQQRERERGRDFTDDFRRRQEEAAFRRTPVGGAFGPPPPHPHPQPPPGQRR